MQDCVCYARFRRLLTTNNHTRNTDEQRGGFRIERRGGADCGAETEGAHESGKGADLAEGEDLGDQLSRSGKCTPRRASLHHGP